MVRALIRWWIQWRVECEDRELLQMSLEGRAGSEYTANALRYINRMRRRLEHL